MSLDDVWLESGKKLIFGNEGCLERDWQDVYSVIIHIN